MSSPLTRKPPESRRCRTRLEAHRRRAIPRLSPRFQIIAVTASAAKTAGHGRSARQTVHPRGLEPADPGGYRQQVADVDRGWRTERLDLEPVEPYHAAELAPLLDDMALHEFTGGAPLSQAALAVRYAWLASRRSPDGSQLWGNWVIRVRATGTA